MGLNNILFLIFNWPQCHENFSGQDHKFKTHLHDSRDFKRQESILNKKLQRQEGILNKIPEEKGEVGKALGPVM